MSAYKISGYSDDLIYVESADGSDVTEIDAYDKPAAIETASGHKLRLAYGDRSVLAFSGRYRTWNGCAHKTLDPGTRVRVSYRGKSTECVVDDRGPYVGGRVIDLQADQFADLAPLSAGVIRGVTVEAQP